MLHCRVICKGPPHYGAIPMIDALERIVKPK
jgi:hypothetical protein